MFLETERMSDVVFLMARVFIPWLSDIQFTCEKWSCLNDLLIYAKKLFSECFCNFCFVLFFNTFKPSSSVETFFDSLVRQAKIPNIFSLQMCGAGLPVSGSGTNGGSLVGICQSEREDVSLLISLPLFYDYFTSSK